MKKSAIKMLSFVSGLTIATVVVGITISKAPKLRSEIENQCSAVLKTTRSLVDAYQGLSTKARMSTGLIKGETGKDEQQQVAEQARYKKLNAEWDMLMAQSAE